MSDGLRAGSALVLVFIAGDENCPVRGFLDCLIQKVLGSIPSVAVGCSLCWL